MLDAVADTIDASEDTVLTIPAPGVLGNDVPSSGVGAVLVFAPLHGALTLNLNGSAVFDPEANFCGATSFVYRTTDGSQTDDATVTINIACVNDAPIAANDAYVANEDTPLAITTAAGVLSNDSDVDSASLTSTIVNDAIHGTVSLAPDGSFTYEPDADFCGSDHFTYQSNDGSLDSVSPATAEILVTCINDTPVVVDDVYAMVLNTVLTVPAPGVLANDFDVDNLVLSPIFPGSPTNGTVSLNTNGGFTYTPAPTFCGSDSFTYQLTDGTAFSTSGTVTINVACSIDIFSDGFEN